MKNDVVIRNGNIIDGTGSPVFEADIAIDGDRIFAIGKVIDKGTEEINAKGLAVTPGFVDLHTPGRTDWLGPEPHVHHLARCDDRLARQLRSHVRALQTR